MRAIWLVRRNLEEHPGGDTTQILKTAEALRQLGIAVDLATRLPAKPGRYDVAHLFHLDRLWENVPHCRQIQRAGIPSVLSPIYWSSDAFDLTGRMGIQGWLARRYHGHLYRNLRLAQRWALATMLERNGPPVGTPLLNFRRAADFVLHTVSVLLPNSRMEQTQIQKQFGHDCASVVVPNAVDPLLFANPNIPDPVEREGVLCVGRLEPRKNQLNLIRAMQKVDAPLTFVGQAGRFNRRYFRRCLKEAGPHMRFVGQQSPPQLLHFYYRTMVHACVSWYETPGLVNLEAACCGCAVVATPGGCTPEYLKDDACYCEPDDPDSIRQAIELALTQGPSNRLALRIGRDYTWQAAAKKTLAAYQLAMTGRE